MKMRTMKMRKQVYELTEQDLRACSTWEFALDEEGEEGLDEATVRPWTGQTPLDPADGMFVVRASIVLADGTVCCGYLTPPLRGDDSVPAVQPVILTERGQVMLWYGVIAPELESIQEAYEKLGRSRGQVFPVRYASDAPLLSGVVEGSVDGFMHFRSFADQRLVTVV
jgi:hypothetical protein